MEHECFQQRKTGILSRAGESQLENLVSNPGILWAIFLTVVLVCLAHAGRCFPWQVHVDHVPWGSSLRTGWTWLIALPVTYMEEVGVLPKATPLRSLIDSTQVPLRYTDIFVYDRRECERKSILSRTRKGLQHHCNFQLACNCESVQTFFFLKY